MIKVAITGNIASGKSEVQKILEAEGYKVLDTDKAGHEILNCKEIRDAFKDYDVFEASGEISRDKLGKLIFANPDLKLKLEGMSHPKIAEQILSFFEKNKEEKLVFVGIPLVFETKMEYLFNKILLIYTDDTIRKQRLIERSGYSEEYAEVRMRCQLSQDAKRDLADYSIVNNKSKKDLELEVYKFLESV
ncbi:dephospho-CoA kinase [bacterium]|nr:dephospho-CoA kinase [bacterium]